MAKSAEPIVAKTTLTVMNVTEFKHEATKSPKEVIGYKITHQLSFVNYLRKKVTVKLKWGPLPGFKPWKPGSKPPSSARLWSFRAKNSGKTYEANAWDYLYNFQSSKPGLERDKSYEGVGTMISSLCHTNKTCNAEERTNIMFWP